MNKKQMFIVWLMAMSLTVVSISYALQLNNSQYYLFSKLLFGICLPILFIGSVLIYQFRNKEKVPSMTSLGTSKLSIWILIVLFLQLVLLQQNTSSTQRDVSNIEVEVSSLEISMDSIQSDIRSLEDLLNK